MSANKAAQRIDAILTQRRITYTQFAAMLESEHHHMTPKQVVRSIGRNRDQRSMYRHVTPEMISASARALSVSEHELTRS